MPTIGSTAPAPDALAKRRLSVLHAELARCTACPKMIGPVVHGPPVTSPIFLLGQAPGPHEGKLGRPFAWTAGKTLFRWLNDALSVTEEDVRKNVYFAAVARCFPGKARGGGDRRPDPVEIATCGRFVAGEVGILRPRLVLPVGTLAIGQVLGPMAAKQKLEELVGTQHRVTFHGVEVDAIPLPHPSGVSPWPRTEPGKTLLRAALALVASHPATVLAFGSVRRSGGDAEQDELRIGRSRGNDGE